MEGNKLTVKERAKQIAPWAIIGAIGIAILKDNHPATVQKPLTIQDFESSEQGNMANVEAMINPTPLFLELPIEDPFIQRYYQMFQLYDGENVLRAVIDISANRNQSTYFNQAVQVDKKTQKHNKYIFSGQHTTFRDTNKQNYINCLLVTSVTELNGTPLALRQLQGIADGLVNLNMRTSRRGALRIGRNWKGYFNL